MTTNKERIEALSHIVSLYEKSLKEVLEVGATFDTSRLPKNVKAMVDLSVAKTPAFSNIAALSTSNYVMSHVLGQCRPKIIETVYSSDTLGLNTYNMLVSNSGSGKSSSTNTLLKACDDALEIVKAKRNERLVYNAKQLVLRDLQTEKPTATIADVTDEMWQDVIKPLNRTIVSPNSTRGGLSRLLDKLQKEDFGNLSIMFDELGLSLKQGNTTQEVIQLLIESFDVGNTEAPEFKTEEVKESPITGMYSNMLGHTSPKVLFGDQTVRDLVSMLFHTALARRCWFSMPDENEATENDFIPQTLKEAKLATHKRLEAISKLSIEIANISVSAVDRLMNNSFDRQVTFSDEASELYMDYFDYCQKKSQLLEDSSISQIELGGRPFKLGKLAAVWQLWEGSSVLTYDTLAAAIYFAEYNSKYLDKFVTLTSSKAYKLMGDLFKEGKIITLPLDTAITNGYVGRISNDFRDLIDPMNSYLRSIGVVVYNGDARAFEYTPFKHVEETGDYGISYTKVPGILKNNRTKYLNNFEQYRMCNMNQLVKMVSTDTIYNVFKYDDLDGIAMKRSQATILGSTKLLSIDVDKSDLTMEEIHGYLQEFKHIIATTSDVNNKHKFRILLPVNIEINSDKPDLYKCIMKTVCQDLMIDFDPTSANPAQPVYGYEGAEVLIQEDGNLYDIGEILTDCAGTKSQGLVKKEHPKTPAAKKKLVDEMMANANVVFDYVINCKAGTGSLSMARASLHMLDSGFTAEQYEQVMNYLNSMWQSPMETERFAAIIGQYSHRMGK